MPALVEEGTLYFGNFGGGGCTVSYLRGEGKRFRNDLLSKQEYLTFILHRMVVKDLTRVV